MITVLTIFGTIIALFIAPVAIIMGLIGCWMIGFWGALIGIVTGLFLQFGDG